MLTATKSRTARKTFLQTLFFFLLVTQLTFAQKDGTASAGPIPKLRLERNHTQVSPSDNPAVIAYGHSSIQLSTLSMPIPGGTPFTLLAPWTPPVFASSMVKGPDGSFYITEVGPPAQLYQMNPSTGAVTLVGNITGMGAEQPNGISFNGNYYIVSSSYLYSFNLTTLTATQIGPFNTGGLMIDLCFDWSGVCYAYDLVTDAAYTINISTGNATLLGPLGYDANYGQGMSYDYESNTIYLSAFNNATFTGQLRTMDPTTGFTTLIVDWGFDQIAPFALETMCCPCPIEIPTNPNPPNGTSGVPLTGNTLSWTNSFGTVDVELWFGPSGNVTKLYDGAAITSYALGALNYNTLYRWYVVCKDATCGTQGPTWSFTTIPDPNLVMDTVDIFPQNVDYWTGTCSPSAKTQVSLANGIEFEVGWMVFDLSPIVNDPSIEIIDIIFNGYLYNNAWPYWSITPMGSVNPIAHDASTINSQVSNNYQQGVAYSFNQEAGSLTNGWIARDFEAPALTDMKNVLGQGWFAIGIVDFDFSTSYYVEFEGWAEANRPYLTVTYTYLVPVELTSFTAQFIKDGVELNWRTAAETNNQGFQVERKDANGSFEQIGYVAGFGTTTEPKAYSFFDSRLGAGNYTYRLKQIDFDGSYEYSDEVSVEVEIPLKYSLEQNYPNPFNPITKISWQSPIGSWQTLKVYDVLGNEVLTLVNDYKPAGKYETEFNASSLPSGVYFYQLKAGEYVSTKKMILLK